MVKLHLMRIKVQLRILMAVIIFVIIFILVPLIAFVFGRVGGSGGQRLIVMMISGGPCSKMIKRFWCRFGIMVDFFFI